MFPGCYSEMFGLGEQLGCTLNLGLSFYAIERGRGFVVSRGSNGAPKIDEYVFNRPRWTLPLTNGWKRT